MNKNLTAIICSLILGGSILGGSIMLNSSFKSNEQVSSLLVDKGHRSFAYLANQNVLNKSELSEYLRTSEATIDEIIKRDNEKKELLKGVSQDLTQYLPALFLPSGEAIFFRSEVDTWIQYKIYHPGFE